MIRMVKENVFKMFRFCLCACVYDFSCKANDKQLPFKAKNVAHIYVSQSHKNFQILVERGGEKLSEIIYGKPLVNLDRVRFRRLRSRYTVLLKLTAGRHDYTKHRAASLRQ